MVCAGHRRPPNDRETAWAHHNVKRTLYNVVCRLHSGLKFRTFTAEYGAFG